MGQYLTPGTVQDENNQWTNEANVIDGNTSTYATSISISPFTWTAYLLCSYPRGIYTNKLRFWVSGTSNQFQYKITMLKPDETAVQVYNSIPSTGGWTEVTFTVDWYKSVKIEVFNSFDSAGVTQLNEVEIWQLKAWSLSASDNAYPTTNWYNTNGTVRDGVWSYSNGAEWDEESYGNTVDDFIMNLGGTYLVDAIGFWLSDDYVSANFGIYYWNGSSWILITSFTSPGWSPSYLFYGLPARISTDQIKVATTIPVNGDNYVYIAEFEWMNTILGISRPRVNGSLINNKLIGSLVS